MGRFQDFLDNERAEVLEALKAKEIHVPEVDAIKCEDCGSTDVTLKDGEYTCNKCGNTWKEEDEDKSEEDVTEAESELVKSKDYKEFVKYMVKKEGYESFADIPSDELDDFWKLVDSKYNSKAEKGKDGVK